MFGIPKVTIDGVAGAMVEQHLSHLTIPSDYRMLELPSAWVATTRTQDQNGGGRSNQDNNAESAANVAQTTLACMFLAEPSTVEH
jgi:hypothetical protein